MRPTWRRGECMLPPRERTRCWGGLSSAASSRELSARASGRLLSTFPESHPLRDLFAERIAREERSSE